MDPRLVAWARQVKARKRRRPDMRGVHGQRRLPTLWLFTDWARMPNPLPAIAGLPMGLCGVVFRHDAAPGRAALLQQVARACRARRAALVVAGDARLARAARAGTHLRDGRRGRLAPPAGSLVTSSAHDRISLLRAKRAGAGAVFLSPLFPTSSHPNAPALGPLRWCGIARRGRALGCRMEIYVLGGVNGRTVRRIPGRAGGAGAIEAARAAEPGKI